MMWQIHEFDTLPSTNAYAREQLALGKAVHGEVFQAYHQTEGRGRFADRKWEDEAYQSLLMSVVLMQPPLPGIEVAQFHAALVVVRALRSLLKEKIDSGEKRVVVKWPNDVLIDGKKCAGILAEAVWSGDQLRGLILGIGCNVGQETFSTVIAGKATSLYAATKVLLTLEEVRTAILSELNKDLVFLQGTTDPKRLIVEELRKELEWMKSIKGLVVNESDIGYLENVSYKGISEEGALVISDVNNNVHILRTAHVILPSYNNDK